MRRQRDSRAIRGGDNTTAERDIRSEDNTTVAPPQENNTTPDPFGDKAIRQRGNPKCGNLGYMCRVRGLNLIGIPILSDYKEKNSTRKISIITHLSGNAQNETYRPGTSQTANSLPMQS